MMMKKFLGLFLVVSALMVFSCSKDDGDDTPDCDTANLTYTDDIKNILDTNCTFSGCHSATEANLQGAMNDYAAAKTFMETHEVKKAINHQEGVKPMPYPEGTAKLPQCTIDKISAWIDAGTPE